MEIEHINENTIRVRIRDEDLEARGFRFLDLLGNQQQIESFFYSILEEVDLDNEFQQSDAVTFQVMPSRNGLELYISKDKEVHENLFTNSYLNEDEDAQLGDSDSNQFEKIHDIRNSDKEEINEDKEDKKIVIKFKFFDQLIQLARAVSLESDSTNIYLFDGDYYLIVDPNRDGYDYIEALEKQAFLLEYGSKAEVTPEYLSEYGDLLLKNNALEQVVDYFGYEEDKTDTLFY